MGVLEEAPHTKPARTLCIGAAVVVLGAIAWAAYGLAKSPDGTHLGRFLATALLLGLEFYLLWLIWTLSSVSYRLESGVLALAQGWQRLNVSRGQILHVHRWRHRWVWNGAAQTELGVEEIALFPPIWIGPPGTVWVVVYEVKDGERKAVALQPSPQLVGTLKEWTLQRTADA